MAATLAYTDVDDALRVMYADNDIDQALRAHPLLAMVERDETFHDPTLRIPVKVVNPLGVATSLSTAQSNAAAGVPYAFNLTRVSLYAAPKIAGELVEAAKNGGAEKFLRQAANIIDGAKDSVTQSMGSSLYRSSSGALSTVASGTASPITLAYAEDTFPLEIGMVIAASANADMSSPRSGTGTITAIDRDAGTVTYSGTITSIAPADYIAVSGQTAVASGLAAWAPAAAPSATSFFGVDRTANDRLAGRRVNCTTCAAEETFAKVNAVVTTLPIQPDVFFINPQDLANFETALAGQRQIVNSRKYDMGFEALSAYGVKIIPDGDCPRGTAFGVPMDHWKLYSLGPAPKVLDGDGNIMMRISNADDYESRIGARYNTASDAPNALINVALPT
jgi:hypothetical protein